MDCSADSSIFRGRGGLGDVLKVAFPLIVASLVHAVNLFTDRMMLAAYSPLAMAAAFSAGLTSFTLSCIFLGTVGYAGVFVAQYTGAKEHDKVAQAVWQAVFLALLGGAFLAGTSFFADELFRLFGHDPEIQPMEATYYRILSLAGAIPLVMTALSVFWSGRAKTAMIMEVNLTVTLCNIPLNYLLIFGPTFRIGRFALHFPEMGIAGAAWGTAGAAAIGLAVYLIAFLLPSNRRIFAPFRHIFAPKLFVQLLRYGLPTGLQLGQDLVTFNIFIILLGKISAPVLTACGAVFSIYSLAFNPMIGFGQTASILVGQGVGANDIPFAERSVRSASLLLVGYSALMAAVFLLFPEMFNRIFSLPPGEVRRLTRIMLLLTAAYMLFDGMNVLFSNAVKGAGDTCFVMIVGLILGWGVFALPCMAAYWYLSGPGVARFGVEQAQELCVWTLWSIMMTYITLLGGIFFFRYRGGKWKTMRVI